jgi:hypothetical protein
VGGLVLATISDNLAHGYNLTFAFPMILFIVIAGALYLVYSRPHKVPGHGPLRLTGGARPASGAVQPGAVPDADSARAAATAAGLSTAAGGGSIESVHEAAGAHAAGGGIESVPEAAGAHAAGGSTTSGSVSEDNSKAAADGPASDEPPAATTPPDDEDEATE